MRLAVAVKLRVATPSTCAAMRAASFLMLSLSIIVPWFVSKSDNTGGGRIVQLGSEQSVGAVRFLCIIKMYLRMDKNLRKERMSELKRRLYSGIPADAGFNVNQLLIVQGLLFDAVDDAVSEYERLLEEVADDGHKVVSYL